MADKQFKVKVVTEADFQNVKDLKKELEDMKESHIKVDADIGKAQSELDELTEKSAELKKELAHLQQYGGVHVHGEEIEKLTKEIEDIDNRRLELYAEIDDAKLKAAKKEVDDLDGEKAEIDVDADDSQIKTVHKEVDDLNGEKVQVDVDVDDSQVKSVKKEIQDLGDDLSNSLGNTSSAVTGVIAGMAGKSIWDTIYGTSKKAETNKILLKNNYLKNLS